VTLATPAFEKFLRDHVRILSGNMRVKFEVRSCNRFGAIIDRSSAHRHIQSYRHISNEKSISRDKYSMLIERNALPLNQAASQC